MLTNPWVSVLRRQLKSGTNLDEALALMRRDGATISECIASVKIVLNCEVIDAKRTVETSRAWADVAERTAAEFERELSTAGTQGSESEGQQKERLYHALISTDPAVAARRVTVVALDISDARTKLEAEYGVGNVFYLHNKEDAERPR